MNTKQFRVRKGKDIRLSRAVTRSDEAGSGKKRLRKKLTNNIGKISDLQYKLYAENRQSLLVIFQGMDSSGKDGTIKSIMNGVNPQGGRVFFCICLFFFVPSRLCASAAMHSHRRCPASSFYLPVVGVVTNHRCAFMVNTLITTETRR